MTAIAAFTLTSTATQAAAPFKIGHAFKKGDVPSGQYLALDLSNFSIVPLRLWNDGSVKHAVIIGRAALTANVARQVNITASGTSPSAGTALTAASITAAAPTASVQCGSIGTVSLSALLAAPIRTFISTKEMVECHYGAAVGADPSLFVHFHVRLYADGRMWIRAVVTNSFLNGSEVVQKDYIPTVIIGGVTVFSNAGAAYHHSPRARWDATGWIGTDPAVTPRHDTGYLNRTKLVPNYWKVGTSQSALDAWNGYQTYHPGDNLAYTAVMGATGYQDQIGLLANWEAVYLASQGDAGMYKVVIAHARAINSYAIAYLDQSTHNPIRISDFSTWSLYGAGQGGSSGEATVKQDLSVLSWERAHFPSAGYLAYLLTADYYFLEVVTLTALTVYLCNDINGGSGVNRKILGQNRAIGWGYRALAQAAAVYPSSLSSLFGDLSAWLAGIAVQKVADYVTSPTATAYIGYEDFYNNRLDWSGSLAPNGQLVAQTAPWEHHFTTMSIGMASDVEPVDAAGMVNLNLFRDYLHGAPVWITGGTGTAEFNFGYSSNYTVNIRVNAPTSGTFDGVPHSHFIAADPGVIFSDTFATTGSIANATTNVLTGTSGSEPISPSGYYGNLLPALAYAVDHGKTGAAASWARFIGATNFSAQDVTANYADNPVWGIVPRSHSQPALLFTAVDSGAIVPTPGPSFVWDTVPLVTGGFLWDTYRGLGIPVADIPTGFPQLSLLENDINVPTTDPTGTEYRWEALTGPGGGTWVIYSNSSFTFTGPDGTYGGQKRVWKNGAYDDGTYSFVIGAASTVTGVSVSPSTATGSTTFSATVAGTGSPSQSVTWATTAGSITSGGVFTAPTQTGSIQTVTVTATSVQDATKSGTATVTIAAAASTVTGVTVAPTTATVNGGTNRQFAATVAGTFSPSQAVTWATTGGTISSGGLLTAPAATGSIQTLTITATSAQDPSKSGTSTVTVPVVLAPRFARPSADVSAGGWLPSSGSALYPMIDETVADSSDYIVATSAGTAVIALNPVQDPGTSVNQVARYQICSPSGSNITVRLMQGATLIASWTHTAVPATWTIYAQPLTGPQCDSITDYTALRFEFVAG